MKTPENVYLLCVAIDAYQAPVPALNACVGDAEGLIACMRKAFPGDRLRTKLLTNAAATRPAVIEAFRSHLGQAGAGDLAVFYFSGHGSRQPSAPAFRLAGLTGEAEDETLVCHDSRQVGGYDLADKELAWLIAEVAKSGPRLLVLADCCHSGGVTRLHRPTLPVAQPPVARFAPPTWPGRSLDSYLGGVYAALQELYVPEAAHIALSACRHDQKAYEHAGKGVFTQHLTAVIDALGPDLPIPELMFRLERGVREALAPFGRVQTPQVELYGGLRPDATLASGEARTQLLLRPLSATEGGFHVAAGAIDGWREGDAVSLFDAQRQLTVSAVLQRVGPVTSCVQADLPPDMAASTRIRVTASRRRGLKVAVELPAAERAALADALRAAGIEGLAIVPEGSAMLRVVREAGRLVLVDDSAGRRYRPPAGDTGAWLADALRRVIRWQNGLAMQGNADHAAEVAFYFADHESGRPIPQAHLVLGVEGPRARRNLLVCAEHLGAGFRYFTLVYFSREYGIRSYAPVPVRGNSGRVILFGSAPGQYVYLPAPYPKNTDFLRLLITDERPAHYLIDQRALDDHAVHRESHDFPGRGAVHDLHTWSIKDLALTLQL